MSPEPEAGAERPPREIRLEGIVLLAAGCVLVVALVGAFFLGRWFEREVSPPRSADAAQDPLGHVAKEPAEASDDLTFFDTLSGPGKAPEPQREAASRPGASPPAPPPTSRAPARPGGFFVQVFAGRDRGAAEEIIQDLGARGYAVRIESEREGRGSLFKVRVGGYPSRAEAISVAARLRQEGHPGAWVPAK